MKGQSDDGSDTFKLAYWANKALGALPDLMAEPGFDRTFYDSLYHGIMKRLVPSIKRTMGPNFQFARDDNQYLADFLVVTYVYYKGRNGQGNFRDLGETVQEEIEGRLDFIVHQMVDHFKAKYS